MENTMRIREHIGNLMRTHWELREHVGNKGKMKTATPRPQNLEEKKLAA
jgi:hypothetical protein